MKAAILDDRRLIAVTGAEAAHFLHNVVTNTAEGLSPGAARYSALLSPQGKILADFLMLATAEGFLLDVPAPLAPEIVKKLKLYRLRAKVAIEEQPELVAAVVWDATAAPGLPNAFTDPRAAVLGFRAFLPRDKAAAVLGSAGAEMKTAADWHAHRIALGIPEGGLDFAYGDAFPHEADMDALHGVDFAKGCYVGQEVVSRMQHRATVRSRVVPVAIEGATPAAGTEIRAGEKPAGTMGSSAGNHGLALVRLDRVEDALAAGQPLRAGEATLTLVKPAWARFRFPGEPVPAESRA
jgi:folate-binding protein YgfZ